MSPLSMYCTSTEDLKNKTIQWREPTSWDLEQDKSTGQFEYLLEYSVFQANENKKNMIFSLLGQPDSSKISPFFLAVTYVNVLTFQQ